MAKKTWFNGLLKEGTSVMCIEYISEKDREKYFCDLLPDVGRQYSIRRGCITLDPLDGFNSPWPVIGFTITGNKMPTAQWFFNHFAICS